MIPSSTMSSLRRKLYGVCTLVLTLAVPAMARQHKMPQVQPATSYADVEVHEKEHVAIAAEPYDTKEKGSLFRVDYLSHGVMPIWLVVTNTGDKPISLRDARILFEPAKGDEIQAAEVEDVLRLMTKTDRMGTKIPMPTPFPSIHTKAKGSLKDIQADFDQFEYGALVVEPHTTRAGFLFYDVSELDNPLKGAKLHLFKLRDADGKELFYFEIPFDKYLQSKSSAMK